jgi:hypothetical protein
MCTCVFSLSSSYFLIIMKAGSSERTSADLTLKQATPANNATQCHSLLSARGSRKRRCSRAHPKAGKTAFLGKSLKMQY